ncbi:hypothetical protein [Methylomusa anaerophila]|uniref:Uncharacterized protein n=1 Tax=Methylomusa anaerophila TaxID=1930071 RepID=A0A348ALR3_9FIRM|nr:hypothetical protein [Methylomusa anaerophila]BBB92011.1 hypothetical protein MAMMFC1_02696 [Methylomusa anaerophila]
MKDFDAGFTRSPEEIIKFKCLMRTLIWAQEKTGKSSAEIVSVIFRKGKMVVDRAI